MTRFIISLVLIIFTAGCDISSVPENQGRGSSNSGIREGLEGGTAPRTILTSQGDFPEEIQNNLLLVSTDIQGTPSVGKAIDLDVIVETPVAAASYKIEVFSPEVTLASGVTHKSGGRVEMRPLYETSGSSTAGGQSTHRVHPTINSEGAYTLIVNVTTEPNQDYPEAASSVSSSIWVEIAAGGGRVIEDIHAEWTNEESLTALGQRTASSVDAVSNEDNSSASQGLAGYSTVQVLYHDLISGNNTLSPVPGAKVATHNSGSGGQASYTDANGYASVVCSPSGSPSGYTLGEVRTEGSNDVRVYRDPSWYVPYNETTLASGFVDPPCGQVGYLVIDQQMASVYAILQKSASYMRSYFGQSRGIVEAFVIKEEEFSNSYNPSSDNIKIWSETAESNSVFAVTSHEYGHAYQHRALGSFDSNQCGEPHSLQEGINMRCAFAEGFADFVRALSTDLFFDSLYPNAPTYYKNSLIGNISNYYNFPVWYEGIDNGVVTDQTPVLDGSRVEVAVASVFFDMYDGVGVGPYESGDEVEFDFVQYSGPYMASILRNCSASPGVSSGIDETLSCVRGTPVPYGGNFFTERSVSDRITSVTGGPGRPANWNLINFDKLWKKDVFRIHPYVAPPPNPNPITASIGGPSTMSYPSSATYTSSVYNNTGSVSYLWEYMFINNTGGGGPQPEILDDQAPPVNTWYYGGSNASYILSASNVEYIDLRLTVTDNIRSHISTKRIRIIR